VKRSYDSLAEFFEDASDEQGLTQDTLASELGITQAYLSFLLRGERQPSLPLAIKIAERCRVPIASLLKVSA
jgi:transcriptional regulator with XRE-family HTH domain